MGLRVDSAELLSQLMIARMQSVPPWRPGIPEIRRWFVDQGVAEVSLEDDVARAATKAWLESALVGSRLKDRRHWLIDNLARGAWDIEVAPPPPPDFTGEELETAQLRVLGMTAQKAPPDEIRKCIDNYLSKGMPQDTFDPSAMRAAAMRRTIEFVRKFPQAAPGMVARHESQYGIDPEEVYKHLPATDFDFAAEIESVLQQPDRAGPAPTLDLLARTSGTFLRPADVQTIIATCERFATDKSRRLLLDLLKRDWSAVGRDHLYRLLSEESDPKRMVDILKVLAYRVQFTPEPLAAVVQRCGDDAVLEQVFEVAEQGLQSSARDEARGFLTRALSNVDAQPRVRVLAARTLLTDGRRHDLTAPLLQAVANEGDPLARAALIREMRMVSTSEEVNAMFWDRLGNDPSPEVRMAALDGLDLLPNPGAPGKAENEARIARLIRTVGPDAPTEVKAAVDAKVAAYRQGLADVDKEGQLRKLGSIAAALSEYSQQIVDPAALTPEDRAQAERTLSEADQLLEQSYDPKYQESLAKIRRLVDDLKAKLHNNDRPQ